MRATEGGKRLGLALEPLLQLGVGCDVLGQDLDRYRAIEARVGGLSAGLLLSAQGLPSGEEAPTLLTDHPAGAAERATLAYSIRVGKTCQSPPARRTARE